MRLPIRPLALALITGLAAAAWNGTAGPAEAAGTVATAAPTRHPGRNGPLTDQEMAMARAAWQYFVGATQEKTGLANSVLEYPSTTMWDTASYISGLVSAEALGIIDRHEFDTRMSKLLGTLASLALFRNELPNKVYNTTTGEKVDYANKPGEVGYSALDIGRLLIWLAITKQRYPYLANAVDHVALRWNFCHVIGSDGHLQGAGLKKDGGVLYYQEGRLGYEEYAAKGFGLWGFRAPEASKPQPYAITDINGVPVPYDSRDPRTYKTMNYVVSESYILDGIELNFDLPDDMTSDAMTFSDGWRAEFAQRVYKAQERRFEETGILTARTEHQVDGAPFFAYDTIFADGYAWNTLSPDDKYVPERAAVAAKGALGLWALWNTPYTDKLFAATANLYTKDGGFYEGFYEDGKGAIPLQTANNNGIILAELLYKVEGSLWRHQVSPDKQVWFTNNAGTPLRYQRCLPSGPLAPGQFNAQPCQQACCQTRTADAANAKPQPVFPAAGFLYCDAVLPTQWDRANGKLRTDLAAHNCDPERSISITYRRQPATN